jgi:hypothetical protein
MSNSGVEYDIKNKERYDDFKIIKNNLVIIPVKITETNILPIITNISYDNGNVKLDNYIYHYLQKTTADKYNIKKNNLELNNLELNNLELNNIINKEYNNIIIYQNNGSKYKYCILNNTDITTLLNNDSNIEKSYKDDQNNNFEEYYLKNKGEEEEEKYIRFKIFISLIIISIDNENLIIFDYNKISPLNIQQYNIATPDNVLITNTEFENLNKLVITKAIYEDNPFDYLSDQPQS